MSNKSGNLADEPSEQSVVHTPGPWRADRRYSSSFSIEPNVAWLGASTSVAESTNEANAKLIAAAPDLLAACELVELWMLGGQPGPRSDSIVLEQVKSAIRNATS